MIAARRTTNRVYRNGLSPSSTSLIPDRTPEFIFLPILCLSLSGIGRFRLLILSPFVHAQAVGYLSVLISYANDSKPMHELSWPLGV